MDLYLLKDYIGLYAPILLFFVTLLLLRNMHLYLQFFFGGFIFNNIINILLKLLFKEPRPGKDQKAIEIGVVNGARISFDKFGMPSGHAQNCAFCTAFITFALNSPLITCIYSIITLISVCQRYTYNNHTIFQLLVGLVIGTAVGLSVYFYGKTKIKGKIEEKPDDNGPI
jgi:membrane-associated phospholipid phosphatase